MQKIRYFDHAATTAVKEEVLKEISSILEHMEAMEVRRLIIEDKIRKILFR